MTRYRERSSELLGLMVDEYGSQIDVARRVGIDQGQLSNILSGKRNVGARLASQIENRLGLAPGTLFSDQPITALPPLAAEHPTPAPQACPEADAIRQLSGLEPDEFDRVLAWARLYRESLAEAYEDAS